MDARPEGLRPDEGGVLALLAAVWGGSFLFIKVAVEELSPITVVAVRLGLGALVVGGWLVLRHGRARVQAMVAGIRPLDALVLAVTGSALPFLLITWAETRISSSLAGILNATVPLFTALLAFRLDPVGRLRGWRSAGLLLGFGGVAVVAGGDLSGAPLAGVAMLAAALSYGVSAHHARRRFAGVAPSAVALVQAVGGFALSAPLALAVGRPDAMPSGDAVAALLALGLGGTGLAYFLYYWLLDRAGAQHAVAVTFLVPVFAVIWGRLVLDERMSASALLGAAVIIAGVLVTAVPARRGTWWRAVLAR